MNLLERLERHRGEEQRLNWSGTFGDYFELAVANPRIAQLAHARIYQMIMDAGVTTDERGVTRYEFFGNDIFGIEKPIEQIVDYFRSSAQRLEVRKRILLLMGPVGGGKSSIVTLLKKGLEQHTRTDEGALYAIARCPMHEEPLHLVPEVLRADLYREHGLYVEGALCPHCHYWLGQDGSPQHPWGPDFRAGHAEDVPVVRIAFSEKDRRGIGTFQPSDPKCLSADTIVLTDRGMLRFDEIQREVGAPEDYFVPLNLTVEGRGGRETTSHFYNGGVKPTRRIKTRLGYELEGSLVHPVLVLRDGQEQWVRLGDLAVGDCIGLRRNTQLFGDRTALPPVAYTGPKGKGRNGRLTLPMQIDERLARLLGYIVAEGSLTDTAVWITNGDRRVLDDIHTLCRELFSVEAREYPKADGSCCSISISSMELVHWLSAVCGITRGAANKRVPLPVMTAPRPVVLAFLEGLFWGDGTISARKSLGSNRFKIATASQELGRQVQTILLNLGILSARYRETIQERFTAWSVVVTGDAVIDLVALLPSLRGKCTDGAAALVARRGRTNVAGIPQLHGLVRTVIDDARAARPQALPYTDRYATTASWGRRPTRPVLERIINEAETVIGHATTATVTLREQLDPSRVWLPVEGIVEGEARVYDLTVPGTHSFCANGFVNHNSQDVAELTGSIDLSTIGEVGSESDPRAYRFDGELNVANRGLVEFVEILKADERFLYVLLSLSQEQNIKTGRFAMIYADEVIVSHTNEHEYNAFVGNKKSEALQDRIILVKVPYNLRVSDEVRIYEKLLKQSALSGVHIAPYTLPTSATFAVLTRLEESKKAGMSPLKKLKLYDGEAVEDWSEKDVKELRDETQREGLDGISPRYVINRLSSALVRRDISCINAIDALRALRDGLEQHTSISKEQRERYLNFISEARKEYDERAKKEVQRAFVYSYEESAKTLLNNYLDNVEAFCNKTKVTDPMTGEEVEPDERLMRSIEEQIGVTEGGKRAFREEILIRISSLARRGQTFGYDSHERLKEAIEKKLFADMKDVVKITTSTKTPDADQLRRINEVIDRLVRDQGYCPVCASNLLSYVGALLQR